MDKKELQWDKKLKIVTVGNDNSKEDENHFPYEPTPYSVLERIVKSGYLSRNNYLVDYGSGKGRVDFFLNYKLGCQTLGIEFNPDFYELAIKNHKNGLRSENVNFLLINAEDYEVDCAADCFYFFNPFSVKILRSVIAKIKASYYENLRELLLFFYYPSDEYISYLMSIDELEFVDDINCQDLFDGNNIRECVLIFTMNEDLCYI